MDKTKQKKKMKILKHLRVPTGDILVIEGSKGSLEIISVGDYGKARNIKADFLGFPDQIKGVPHGNLMPLQKKWVITLSTQYGCSMGCPYCDVPKVGPGINASFNDLVQQILTGIHLHPEVEKTERLNIHFARMGEPSFNPNVLDVAKWAKQHLEIGDDGEIKYKLHPVVSTIMPKNNQWLRTFINTWMKIKNRIYSGNAGLQISLNSTDEKQREYLFNGKACSIPRISQIMEGIVPFGRKITLNIILTDQTIIDPHYLINYFDPEYYLIKITPVHETTACKENLIYTTNGYTIYEPYEELENALKNVGYDVIVFIPSIEEDKGLITCGNVILSGSTPNIPYKDMFSE